MFMQGSRTNNKTSNSK